MKKHRHRGRPRRQKKAIAPAAMRVTFSLPEHGRSPMSAAMEAVRSILHVNPPLERMSPETQGALLQVVRAAKRQLEAESLGDLLRRKQAREDPL